MERKGGSKKRKLQHQSNCTPTELRHQSGNTNRQQCRVTRQQRCPIMDDTYAHHLYIRTKTELIGKALLQKGSQPTVAGDFATVFFNPPKYADERASPENCASCCCEGQREREYHSAVTHRQSAQSTHVADRAEHSTLEDLRACTTNTHVALRQGRRAEKIRGLGRKCQQMWRHF